MNAVTDWDAYYRSVPNYTTVTRRITQKKILGLLWNEAGGKQLEICELSGANSCFVEQLCKQLPISRYHVVDLNAYGLQLLRQKKTQSRLTWESADVLAPVHNGAKFDVVYSVGLIEHFDRSGTTRAIAAHFDRCRAGGLVLITFPTPTLPYRWIRSLAELAGIWKFPDERPLEFAEVAPACEKYGVITHRSINWLIGLTQGYVVVRKGDR
jgi:SAM-dependent methyltransferase